MKLVTEVACGTVVEVASIGFTLVLCLASFAMGFAYGAEAGAKFSRVKRLENRLAQVQSQLWRAREIIRPLFNMLRNDKGEEQRAGCERAARWLGERH